MPVVNELWWAPLFFVTFTVIATLGVLNLIIGVISERTAVVQKEYRDLDQLRQDGERMQAIEEISGIMFTEEASAGDEEEFTITKKTMQDFVDSEEYGVHIKELVCDIKLPVGYEVTDCHAMFDRDASGTITKKEFIEGMGRLIFSNDFQRNCMVQSSIADVLVEIKAVESRLHDRFASLESRLPLRGGGGEDDKEETRPRPPAAPPQPQKASPRFAAATAVPAAAATDEEVRCPALPLPQGSPPFSNGQQISGDEAEPLTRRALLLLRLQEPLQLLLADELGSQAALPVRGGQPEAQASHPGVSGRPWKPEQPVQLQHSSGSYGDDACDEPWPAEVEPELGLRGPPLQQHFSSFLGGGGGGGQVVQSRRENEAEIDAETLGISVAKCSLHSL